MNVDLFILFGRDGAHFIIGLQEDADQHVHPRVRHPVSLPLTSTVLLLSDQVTL